MKKAKHRTETIILWVFFALYFIVLLKITVFRDSNPGDHRVNLTPFITIAKYFRSILNGNKIIGIANIAGNLIIFFPLGYISALLFPKMRKLTRILIFAIVSSLVIEGGQYILSSGAADIDDVILNALGGIVGYWTYILTTKFLKLKKYAILISALMIAFTCAGFFVGNNHKDLMQGDVVKIRNDSIVISRTYRYRPKDGNTSSTRRANEYFEVAFSENCKITLVELQQNGKMIGEKTMTKNDIRLNDSILLNQFLLNQNGIYTAMDIEIHRYN